MRPGRLQVGVLLDRSFAKAERASSRGSACSQKFVAVVAERPCCLVACFER